MVTAEHKVNRFGSRYIYYHCTKRRLGPRCPQPSIEAYELERQIGEFLSELSIPERLHRWIIEEVGRQNDDREGEQRARVHSLKQSLSEVSSQLGELTGLRLRNLLSDDEFLKERQRLQTEQLRLQEQLRKVSTTSLRFEPDDDFIIFRNRAAFWFVNGDREARRLILTTVGSNLTLTNKKLSIEAKKPFQSIPKNASYSHLLATINDVRTRLGAGETEIVQLLTSIREIRARAERSGHHALEQDAA